MTSVLSSAAAGKKQIEKLARLKTIKSCANNIAVALKMRQPTGLQSWINHVLNAWRNDWTGAEVSEIMIKAAQLAFGSPMTLSKDQLQLRQYANQYYNPTGHTLNVEPMGLPDENGKVIKKLVPGGLILIPHSYELGGKRSVINCTAPQLRKMEIVPKQNNLLDATPVSYAEWLKYYPYQLSKCCRFSLMWSDAKQMIVCWNCKQEVKFIYA